MKKFMPPLSPAEWSRSEVVSECQEAQDYFDQIEDLDKLIADNLDSEHNMAQSRHNALVRSRPEFKVGDLVWVMKPKWS